MERVNASAATTTKLKELGYKFARERNVATPAITDAQKPLLVEVTLLLSVFFLPFPCGHNVESGISTLGSQDGARWMGHVESL